MIKLSPQQEKFCQEVVKGKSQSAAYRVAYPKSVNWLDKSVNSKASTLSAGVNVKARISEMRAPIIKRVEITLADHLDALEGLRNRAESANQFSAAIKAEESRGKASGLYVEKVVVAGDDDHPIILRVELVAPK